MSDGPALNWRPLNFAGATDRSKSPEVTPSTAWACVKFGKKPNRTSATKPPSDAWVVDVDPAGVSLLLQPAIIAAITIVTMARENVIDGKLYHRCGNIPNRL